MVNAILYLTRTGCGWKHLPHEFPPWPTVHNCFRAWQQDATWDRIDSGLRERMLRKAKRKSEPKSAVLDSQTVKTTDRGGDTGFDAGTKCSDEGETCSSTHWDSCSPSSSTALTSKTAMVYAQCSVSAR